MLFGLFARSYIVERVRLKSNVGQGGEQVGP